jgi:hypothetical protein
LIFDGIEHVNSELLLQKVGINQCKQTGPLHWAREHLSLRNEAHHRATLDCEAPAIVWHVGVWPERELDPQDASASDTFNARLQSWVEDRIQTFMRHVLALGQPNGARSPRSFYIDRNDSSPEIDIWTAKPKAEEFLVSWRGLTVQTRMEIHPDYAIAIFVIPLGDNATHVVTASGADAHDKLVAQLRDAVRQAGNENPRTASDGSLLLFSEAWRTFIFDICRANGIARDEALIPGHIFVSLRGVVLELHEDNGKFVSVIDAKGAELDKTFSAEDAHEVIGKFESFLSRGDFKNDDREFVAARIIQNRAIFISPLGARSLHEERDDPLHYDPRRSTRFTILAKGDINSRQLGRTVSQILSLGTLQIMALKDVGIIRAVGTAIRFQSNVLDTCARALKDAIQNKEQVPHEVEAELCKLESKLDDVGNQPTGGLAYRVFRSSYYANEFLRRLENLNSQDISRWQNPETFFAKRLYSVFDYIQNVGARMERLRRRISDSLETIQAKTLVDLTHGVHNIQRSGEVLSIILFIIGVSTFSGEVLEPAYQTGFSAVQIVPVPDACVPGAPDLADKCKAAFKLNGYSVGALVAGALFFIGRSVVRRLRRAPARP